MPAEIQARILSFVDASRMETFVLILAEVRDGKNPYLPREADLSLRERHEAREWVAHVASGAAAAGAGAGPGAAAQGEEAAGPTQDLSALPVLRHLVYFRPDLIADAARQREPGILAAVRSGRRDHPVHWERLVREAHARVELDPLWESVIAAG